MDTHQSGTATARRAVTIVVPIYGDLPSIMECIDSLTTSVDLSEHRVMLVNDVGPDADEIESAILSAIDGRPSFRYFRNDHNLGFVGTCNRAALELDHSGNDMLLLNSDTVVTPGFVEEMRSVLELSPRHGVVTARSNSATIASLPYRLADPQAQRSFERTRAAFSLLSEHLPRFTVAPVAMGFCFLTRRALIDKYGLFDDVFAPGYGEENDYCLRINKAGYLALIANRALVLHEGSKSFADVGRNEIRDAHEVLLERRYPFYRRAVRLYNYFGVSAAEWFADVLTPRDARRKACVDIRGLTEVVVDIDRATTMGRMIVDFVVNPLQDDFDVELLADTDLVARLGIDPAAIRVTTVLKDPVQISDLGLVFGDSATAQRLTEANRRYLHWGLLSVTPPRNLLWARQQGAAKNLIAETDLRRHSKFDVELQGAGSNAIGFLGIDSSEIQTTKLRIGDSTTTRGLADEIGAVLDAMEVPEILTSLNERWLHFTTLEHYLSTATAAATVSAKQSPSAPAAITTPVRSRIVRTLKRRLTRSGR